MMEILRPGAGARKALDELQANIAATAKSIDEVARARLPKDEARERVRQVIDNERTKPGATSFGRFAAPPSAHHAPRVLPELDWSLLIALLGAKVVEDRICEAIEASSPAPGLPRAARQAKLEELRAHQAQLARAEEIEILRLEDAGHIVLRRSDVDVAVVLGIWNERSGPLRSAPPARERDQGARLSDINQGLHTQPPVNLE